MLLTNTNSSSTRMGHPRRYQLAVLLIVLAVLVPVVISGAHSAHSAAPPQDASSLFVREYPIPTSNGSPKMITVEAPGRVWFTMPEANKIGHLVVNSPSDYQFSEYTVPTVNSYPYDLVYHDGAIWFTERDGNKIGRLDTTSLSFQQYSIPTLDSKPLGIAVAPDGKLWFAENASNKLGRFDPATETFKEYMYGTLGAELEAVSAVAGGVVWVTAPALNRVLGFDEDTEQFDPIPVVDFGVSPFPPGDVASDESGMPWITAPTKDLVGRYAPGTLAYWRWVALASGGHPTGITVTLRDGIRITWVVKTSSGQVAQIGTTPLSGTLFLWEVTLPTPNSQPRDVAVDAAHHAWITEMAGHQIAEWLPPYQLFTHLPAITRQ